MDQLVWSESDPWGLATAMGRLAGRAVGAWLLLGCLLAGCGTAPGATGAAEAAAPGEGAGDGADQAWVDGPGLPEGSARFVPQVGLTGRADAAGADLSPDGRLALVDGDSGWFEVWELATGMIIRSVRALGSGRGGSHARFLADSKRVACAQGTQILVIDLATGKQERVIEAPAGARAAGGVEHLAVASTANRALAGYLAGFETILAWWDLDAGGSLGRLTIKGRVDALALSPDGKRALSAVARSGTAELTLWDLEQGKTVRSWTAHDRPVDGLALSRDGRLAVSTSHDRQLIVWDLRSGQARRTIKQGWPQSAPAFSADGKHVAAGDVDGLYVWSVATGKRVQTLSSRNREPAGLIFAADGKSLVAVGETGPLRVFDLPSGNRRRRLEAPWGVGIASVAADAEGHAIAATSNNLQIWDLSTGRLAATSRDRLNMVRAMVLSPDGQHVLVAGHGAQSYDARTGRRARGYRAGRMGVRDVAYSPDGALVATAGIMDDQALRLHDAKTGKQLRACEQSGQRSVDAIVFSHDGRWLISRTRGAIEVHEVATGKRVGSIAALAGDVRAMTASPSAPVLAVAGGRAEQGRAVRLLELPSGRQLHPLESNQPVSALAYSPDGKTLLVGDVNGAMTLWDTASPRVLTVLGGHHHPVDTAAFSPDGKRVVSGTSEGILRVHTLGRGAPGTSSLRRRHAPWVAFVSSETQWLMYGHDGYFDASRHGARLVALVQGTHAFEPAQFAYRLNRPDVLLRRLGLASPDLLGYLEGRHRLRLRKSGALGRAAAAGLHAPTARIRSAKDQGKVVELQLELSDAKLELASYNVFVNGVGLFGLTGKPLSGKSARVTERVELTRGDNRIEVSCINAAGAESYRAQTLARYEGKADSAIYYLGFGVSKYRDKRLDLAYAHKDAQALARMFERLGPTRKIHTKVLVDGKVTAKSIKAAKRFVAKAKVDDVFVLFIAGHGVHARDRDSTYYFITHDTDVKRLADTAADFELIEDLLVGIKPRRKLLLMDTCQSGEDGGPRDTAALATARARKIRMRNVRGLELVGDKPAKRRRVTVDRDRYIENDLRRRSGAVVLSSSRGNEYSFESDDAGHGMFTKALLDAFRVRRADKDFNLRISADELLGYVSKAVARDTGGQQNPTIDRDNPQVDLALPVVEGSW